MATITATEWTRGKLAAMRPETLAALWSLMQRFEAATGLQSTVPAYGGVRTPAEQQQLLDWRKEADESYAVGGTETSRHVYGGAFDLHILRGGAKVDGWKGGHIAPEYVKLGELGEALGLTWGGRWAGSRADPYHFQLTEPLTQARTAWAAHVGRLDQPARLALSGGDASPKWGLIAALAIGAYLLLS